MALAKDQLRQIIADNNITNVADVYSFLKDGFKDILQELMEAEMDATLGYEKNQKGESDVENKRNGYSTKTVKSQYGEIPLEESLGSSGEAKNFHAYKNILYFENTTKDSVIIQDQAGILDALDQYTILENVKNGEPIQLDLSCSKYVESSEEEGYTFTEADKNCFSPVTDNYIIFKMGKRAYCLISFNDSDESLQYRMRIDTGEDIAPENAEKLIEESFGEGATNGIIQEGVIYIDMETNNKYNRNDVLSEFMNKGYEVLVDKQ